MTGKNQPIRRQLMTVILLTSGAVVLLTCAAFVAYEWVTFRRELVASLTTLAQITADNSTAAVAFENESDAKEVLSALRIERNVVAACLYDKDGKLFARYPANEPAATFPSAPEKDGHRFTQAHLILFQPVSESGRRLGTLYLRSDVSAMYERFQLYGGVAVLVLAISCLVAFAISAALQKRISQPILSLADTAKAISERRDYSVRARKGTQDELGLLTDAFNQMLNQIQAQDSALRASEARKGAILESAVDGIITIDHEGRVVEFNPASERMFGYTRDQLIGKEMVESIIPPSLRERHRHGMAHYLATGEGPVLGRRLELTALRADGTEFPVELSITRIGSEDPPTFTGFLRDITERKRIEQVLRDMNAELERRVATRTAELEAEVTERRRAEALIRTALEEKKTLLEEIHHRVKNNLQIISSLLRLQCDFVKNEEDRAMFAESQNRVRTMALVHERLYRSQNLASINFGEHVRDLANMLAGTYRQAAVQIQVFTEAESVSFQLETAIPAGLIVNELVSNALKHAFPDGRRGTLKVSLHSPAPGQLLLSVADDGVGFPPGFDWDQARSLGLRMVHDLARQIRGTLEICQNGGTTFALSFPVAKPRHKPMLQP